MPASLAPSAAFLTPQEQEDLWRAAITLADSRSPIMRLTAMFGRRIEAIRARLQKTGEHLGGDTWSDLTQRAQDAVEDTLWHSFSLTSLGLSSSPAAQPKTSRAHRVATAISGAASGFIGLPGVLFDIPFTTATILRSIAEIARDSGEDLASEGTRRACLEVLAFGGPSAADDETEAGYWLTRIGMNHLTLNLLMKSAAARFGIILTEKFLAQAVPIAGALAGGALNYAFTQYYQDMARVSFALRALDRRTGQPHAVRQCFTTMLKAARDRRRITRPAEDAADVTYLPR
jgi:hypothetical protein